MNINKLINLLKLTAILIASVTLLPACSSTPKSDIYNDMSAEQIYNKGKTAAKQKKYNIAVKDFEDLEARYPYGEYTQKAQLALIHTYYKQEEAASALAAADRFIRLYPQHKDIDYVYYLKGIINYDENFSTGHINTFP